MATCPYCGKEFDPYAHDWRRRRATTTCGSPECRRARDAEYKRRSRERKRAKAIREIRRCVICGAPFNPLNARQICCSEACGQRRNIVKSWERYKDRVTQNAANIAPAETSDRKLDPNNPVHAIRKCIICGASFKPLNSRHICCSEACGRRRNVLKERERFAARPELVFSVPRADTKAQKLERDLLQVRRDMALPAAERYQAQKSWTKDQRNYARRLYESRHGLFRGAGKMWE